MFTPEVPDVPLPEAAAKALPEAKANIGPEVCLTQAAASQPSANELDKDCFFIGSWDIDRMWPT